MNSVIDDKKGIFNKLSVFTSLKEIELKPVNGFNLINSINNDLDPLPFLLDLSTSLVGTDGLQDKLGLLFTQYIDTFNTKSKELLKNNLLGFNQNLSLPTSFVSNGITIPVSFLDDSNNLKTPKVDTIGEIIYDDSTPNLLTKLREAITAPSTNISFGNINIVYNESSESLNIKPTGNISVGNFIYGYVDSFSGINKREFTADILDKIYGLKSKLQNKTIAELNHENTVDAYIEKLATEQDINLSDEDILKINNKSEEILKGSNEIDCGCYTINNRLTTEQLTGITNTIANSTNPNEVGNAFSNLAINSLDENTDQSNITSIKDGFLKDIIKLIKTKLLKDMLFSPEKKLLFILTSYFDNKDINTFNDISNYIKENKNICDCLVKDISSDIIEFVFNLVKTEIIEITKPALRKIITEKINNYKLLLTSLLSI
jgi:hypothetical protein